MDDVQIGRIVRARRRRLGWRQVDVARRVGCHQTTISKLERGHLASLSFGLIRRIGTALEIRVELLASWRGGELDRLLDERHAHVVDAVVAHLAAAGWTAMPEVTYSEYGERGSIDVLAVHDPTRSAAVFEIKVDLTSVEGTLRKHAEKTRLAPGIVLRECGWRPRSVARILVVPENQTARRVVAAHEATFRSAYPADSRAIRGGCAITPVAPSPGSGSSQSSIGGLVVGAAAGHRGSGRPAGHLPERELRAGACLESRIS